MGSPEPAAKGSKHGAHCAVSRSVTKIRANSRYNCSTLIRPSVPCVHLHHPCRQSTAGLTVGTRRRQRDTRPTPTRARLTCAPEDRRAHAPQHMAKERGERRGTHGLHDRAAREHTGAHSQHGGTYDTVDGTVSGAPRPLPPPRRLACSRRRPAVGSRRARHRDLVVDGRGNHVSWLEGGKPGEGQREGGCVRTRCTRPSRP